MMVKNQDPLSSESFEFPWWLWGFSIFSLIVSTHLHRLFDSVWIVTPQTSTLLGTSMWTPGLAGVLVAAGPGKLPMFVCGIFLSVAITVLIRFTSRRLPIAIVGVWFSMIAISWPVEHTLVLVLTAPAIVLPTLRILRTPGRRLIAFIGLAILAASLTSQVAWPFGMLSLAVLQCCISGDRAIGKAERILLPAVWFLGVMGAVILVPGFAEQLIRPLMTVCTPQMQNVFPSWSVTPDSPLHWILLASFMGLLLMTTWRLSGVQSGQLAGLVVMSGLSFLALGGWFSVMLSGCCLPAVMPLVVQKSASRNRLIPVICLGAAILQGGFHCQRFGIDLLSVRLEDRRIDPAKWNVDGRVLLTNLEQSADWLSENPRPSHSLLLDDRAVSGSILKTYAAACMDWKNSRKDSYIRADGSWGGYFNSFRDWKPSLIVADAMDLESLRHLAIDPTWKVMGIDSQRVIFGSVDEVRLLPQIRDASQLLLQLEFPGQRTTGELTRTLMIGTRVDARHVAMVLNAMRLPYAGLRVLPADQFSESNEVRAWCYAELAHRCRTHSGQVSLLDQYRATIGLRSIQNSWSTSNSTRRRIRRTIESLSLDVTGSETAVRRLENEDRSAANMKTTQALRTAFGAGETDTIRNLLAEMSATPEREFFAAILAASESGPEASTRLLESVTESAAMPSYLRHEGFFYLGCLAIETGDSEIAVNRLRRSVESLKSGPFAPLAEFFLLQLTSAQ